MKDVIEDVIQYFNKKTTFFITLNPYKSGRKYDRYQKLGPVSDWFRRRKIGHFIIRETNTDGSAHYHLIADTIPSSTMKDMNIDVKEIGKDQKMILYPTPDDETADHTDQYALIYNKVGKDFLHQWGVKKLNKYHDCTVTLLHRIYLKQYKKYYMYMKSKRQRGYHRKKISSKETQKTTVLRYMLKTFPSKDNPKLYKDYIFYKPPYILKKKPK